MKKKIPSRPHPLAKSKSANVNQSERWMSAVNLAQKRDFTLLEEVCREILSGDPDHVLANTNLAVVESAEGKYHQAVEYARRAIAKDPAHGPAHSNLAMYYCELRRWGDAKACALRATELMPDNPSAWLNLSWACNSLSHFQQAEMAARRALELAPNMVKAMNNLASALKEQSKPAEAVEIYRRILKFDPDFSLSMGNLLLALQYDDRSDVAEIASTSREAGQLLTRQAQGENLALFNKPVPDKKIRLGFLSPDLCDHAVMYFLEPLVCRLDRSRFEVHALFLYSEGDPITRRFMRFVDRFHVLGGLTPRQQAVRIRDAEIDVLIDVAGHTAKTGLPAMAYRPAPVQGTWLGYPGTTGLSTIDFRVTDHVADQHADSDEYTEQLRFVDGSFCVYRPMIRYPLRRYWTEYEVRSTPALKNGYVTFGCCNNVAKLSTGALQLWANLLERVPRSRLLIEGKALEDAIVAENFKSKCVTAGIDLSRLILVQRDTNRQYLLYHDIDIALDPFPLNGGTTTTDVLWFGLPLVTLEGDRFRSRMTTSFLTAVGRKEWVAKSQEHYIEIAVQLATDIQELNRIRLQQRRRAEASPMMNEPQFAIQFGSIVQEAWLNWCAKQGSSTNDVTQVGYSQAVFIEQGRTAGLVQVYGDINLALDRKDWARVEKLATLTLESLPREHGALAALAEVEWSRGNHQRAVDYMRNAVNHPHGSLDYFNRLAYWLDQIGHKEKAEAVRQALKSRVAKKDQKQDASS